MAPPPRDITLSSTSQQLSQATGDEEATLTFRETLMDEIQLNECDYMNLNFLGNIQGDASNVAFVSYPNLEIVAMDTKFRELAFMKERVRDDDIILGKSAQRFMPSSMFNKVEKAIEDMIKASLLREFVFDWDNDTFYSLCVSTTTTDIQKDTLFSIEIEILDEMAMLDICAERDTLSRTLTNIGRALDLCSTGEEAAKVACDAVFKILGDNAYDRGMVYIFHDDLSGEVIHEIKKEDLKSSYYGMHFPASDVPRSARLLYQKNVVRFIQNVDGQDIPIVSNRTAPIDLTQVRSRCVHKCHLIYCRGMGIKCCMSLALVSQGELWGLLSFHGYTAPFKPSLHQLIACEAIAACVSARVMQNVKKEKSTRLMLMGQLFQKWDPTANVLENLHVLGDQVVNVMEADVLAARVKSDKSAVWSVAKGNMDLLPRGLFWEKMSEQVPTYGLCVKSTKKTVKELDLTDVNCPGSDFVFIRNDKIEIMIGRAYRERDVVWAGDPDAPKINIGGLLHPRASFEAQLEKAKRDANPFDTLDQQLAELLCDLIFRKESNTWALSLLQEKDIQMNIFKSFNAVEDDRNSTGNQMLADLSHYLQTLNLVKPKRLYLSSSKAKSKVSFHDFAHRSLALVKQPSKWEFEVQVDGDEDDCILVDHTEICQVVANVTKISSQLVDVNGRMKVHFRLIKDVASEIQKIIHEAMQQKGFVCVVKNSAVINSIDEVGQEAEQLQLKSGQNWLYYTSIVAGNGYEPDQLFEAFQSYKQIHSDEDLMIIDEVTKIPLSVSVELCRRLGGFMSCSSTPYDGTIFHFAVPVDSVSKDSPSAVKRGENPILLSGPILIVGGHSSDIESEVRVETKRLNIQAEIIRARNGGEALAAYNGNVTPSVMIIDHQMSGMDGLETVTEVRKMEYMRKLQASYIVSYTSDVTNNVAMILLQAGGNELMVKPLPSDFVPNLVCRFQVETATIDEVLGEVMKDDENY